MDKSLTYTTLPLGKLKLNTGLIPDVPKNPRFIRDEKYRKLVESIKDTPEMMTARPLIVYPLGDDFVTLAGNMRLRAMRDLKWKECPVAVCPADAPAKKLREYAIKDNVAFGEDDMDLLANEWDLGELTEWGMDLNFGEELNPEDCGEDFELPSGDKAPFQQMSFTLADAQAELIKQAMDDIKHSEEYKFVETYGNANTNGNALYLIIAQWAEQRK